MNGQNQKPTGKQSGRQSTTSQAESKSPIGSYPTLDRMRERGESLTRENYLAWIGVTSEQMDGELEATLPPEFQDWTETDSRSSKPASPPDEIQMSIHDEVTERNTALLESLAEQPNSQSSTLKNQS